MKLEAIEKVQLISDLVCEGCGLDRDCGIEPDKCDRIAKAIEILNEE